jgi:hypothetical protein
MISRYMVLVQTEQKILIMRPYQMSIAKTWTPKRAMSSTGFGETHKAIKQFFPRAQHQPPAGRLLRLLSRRSEADQEPEALERRTPAQGED